MFSLQLVWWGTYHCFVIITYPRYQLIIKRTPLLDVIISGERSFWFSVRRCCNVVLIFQIASSSALPFAASNCDIVIYSSTARNGSIKSPSYPTTYPKNTLCRFEFRGTGRERIQVNSSLPCYNLIVSLQQTLHFSIIPHNNNNDADAAQLGLDRR